MNGAKEVGESLSRVGAPEFSRFGLSSFRLLKMACGENSEDANFFRRPSGILNMARYCRLRRICARNRMYDTNDMGFEFP